MADPVEPERRARAGDEAGRGYGRRPVRTPYDGPHYSPAVLEALMQEPPGSGKGD